MMKKYIFYLIAPLILLLVNCSGEMSDWQDAKTQNSVQIFEQFIQNYPQSIFKDSASVKIEELSYMEVVEKNNIDDFNKFIEQFPRSIFVDSSNNKILEITIIDAMISKNVLPIVDIIDNNPDSKIIQTFLISSDETVELKSQRKLYEDYTTTVKNTGNKEKIFIQLRVPPKRKISTDLLDFYNTAEGWKAAEQGSLITQYSIVNNRIAGISHYESGDKGLTIEKEISIDEIIPLTSNLIQLDQNMILKTSHDEFLYSTSNETILQRINKTDNFKLIAGNAYQINLKQ